ncbi:MAG TPA: hypothetical protein VGY94_10735 [Acidobacteriaceae bacterium]|jgi:hypothetical protein|nr:hypothetical protein [Acidobacteriaceae bacterium]
MHRCLFWCLLVVLSLFPIGVCAQTRTVAASRAPLELPQVTRKAGIIFSGHVVSIQPVRVAGSDQVASVAVTFQVEQGIRGARAGQRFTFHEWVGLWSGSERYRVGERLMLFLYAPSALGLTSPVGGAAGRFSVDRNGMVLLSQQQQQAIQILPEPVRILRGRVPVRDFVRSLRQMKEE